MCFFTAWASWIKEPLTHPATLYTYYWWGDMRMRSLEEGNKRAKKRIEMHQLKLLMPHGARGLAGQFCFGYNQVPAGPRWDINIHPPSGAYVVLHYNVCLHSSSCQQLLEEWNHIWMRISKFHSSTYEHIHLNFDRIHPTPMLCLGEFLGESSHGKENSLFSVF